MRRTPVHTLVQIRDSLRGFVLISPRYIFKAPPKQSQHFNTTYPDIVGPAFASPGQTIATSQRNISQHCWAQLVARVGYPVATCCMLLVQVWKWSSWANNAQLSWCPKRVARQAQCVAPNNVTICYLEMLRSFKVSFWQISFQSNSVFVSVRNFCLKWDTEKASENESSEFFC